jgi:hypothetical protein
MSSFQQEVDKEIVKSTVKLNMLENEINRLKEQLNFIASRMNSTSDDKT